MIIIAHRVGQLGNRLILFAHLIAFAREHHLEVANLAFDEYGALFESTQDDLYCRYPKVRSWIKPTLERRTLLHRVVARVVQEVERRKLPFVQVCRINSDQAFCLDDEFAEVARRNIVFVSGWMLRNQGGLSKSASSVRDYFRPTESAQKNIQQIVQTGRNGHDLLIGVHVRQTDYENYEGGRYFYTSVQYVALMKKAAALFRPRRVAFLLCSSAPQELTMFADLPVTFGSGDVVEDLYALAGCDYLIGPPSTFSAWASFYGNIPLYHIFSPEAEFTRDDFTLSQKWGRLF